MRVFVFISLFILSNALSEKQKRGTVLARELTERMQHHSHDSEHHQCVSEGAILSLTCERADTKVHIVKVMYAAVNDTDSFCAGSMEHSANCVTYYAEDYIKETCEGQRSCIMAVSDDTFWDEPCPDNDKLLYVKYSCLNPLEKLQHSLEHFLEKYESTLQTPLLELDEWSITSATQGLVTEVLLKLSPMCQEYLLASYVTGLIEYNFKSDHSIVSFVREVLAKTLDPQPDPNTLKAMLHAIQFSVYEPLGTVIMAATNQYPDFVPASILLRDIDRGVTADKYLSWNLEDLIRDVFDKMAPWHVDAVRRCECTPSGGILENIVTSLGHSLETMDRCLVQDRLKNKMEEDYGIIIPKEMLPALTEAIDEYMDSKSYFIWDIVRSDENTEVIFWQIYLFFEHVIDDVAHEAKAIDRWRFLVDFVSEETFTKFVSVVLSSNDDEMLMFKTTEVLLTTLMESHALPTETIKQAVHDALLTMDIFKDLVSEKPHGSTEHTPTVMATEETPNEQSTEKTHSVMPTEYVDVVTANDQSHSAMPTGESHSVMPTGESHSVMPTGESHSVMPTGESHSVMPTGESHSVMPTGESHSVMPTGESHSVMPTGESHSVMPTGESHSVMPTGESHSVMPTGESHNVMPTGGSHSVMPTGESHSVMPTGESHSVMPTGESHSVMPTGESHSVMPTGESPSVMPTGESQNVMPTGELPTENAIEETKTVKPTSDENSVLADNEFQSNSQGDDLSSNQDDSRAAISELRKLLKRLEELN